MKSSSTDLTIQVSQKSLDQHLASLSFQTTTDLSAYLRNFFTKLAAWQGKLEQLLSSGASLLEYLQTAQDYWHSSLTLHDNHYAILGRVGNRKGIFPLEYNHTIGTEVYSSATVSEWMDDPEYLQSMETTDAQWWPVRQQQSLYMNLWNEQGNWRGRVILHPSELPFTEMDRELLSCFGKYLERALSGQSHAQARVNELLADMLRVSAEQKAPFPENTENILNLTGWNLHDRYLCFVLAPTAYEAFTHVHREALTCSNIEDLIPDSRALQLGENIAILVNLSRSSLSIESIRSSLAYIIRENVLKLGISQSTEDFQMLPICYLQACAAIELGRDTTNWSCDFRKLRLAYLKELISRDPLGSSIDSEALKTLRRYDAETHASLTETLAIYLKNERSIKQTAAQLNINRTTVTYRLSRIEELTHLDLEDPDTRLLLLLLFKFK